MKKVIAILVAMIVLVGAAFAANSEQLQINVTVSEIVPIFTIYGGKNSAADADTTIQGNATTPTNINFTEQEANLATTDIKLYIRLYQSNKARYSGTATLTITATPLTHTTLTVGTYATSNPTVGNITKTTPNGITYSANPSSAKVNGNTVVTYAPTYDGRAVQATNIGTFDLTWGHNDDLTAGTYQATITLGITTP